MSLISTSIPNLVNGVSQQPSALRLSSQCEEQINGLASVVEGLRKRPCTRHIARLTTTPSTSAYTHIINRDSTEQYIVVIEDGNLRVFDLNGVEKTVAFPNGKTYLSASNPQAVFRCMTVADYTFVLNTGKVTAKAASLSPARAPEALVWIDQGSYLATYGLGIKNGPVSSYTAPDGNDIWEGEFIRTDYIAKKLIDSFGTAKHVYKQHVATSDPPIITITWWPYVDQSQVVVKSGVDDTIAITWVSADSFTVNDWSTVTGSELRITQTSPSASDYVLTRIGSAIHIKRVDGADFEIDAVDSLAGGGASVIKSTAQSFSMLPARAVDGFTVEIVGDQTSRSDNYYVKYEGSAAEGTWKESVKSGEQDSLDAATMPHGLVREADGTFTFKALDWDKRLVGDTESAPFPSFIGRTINDIFFHRNRLGVIADENIIFSRAGDYFNFFRTSATAVLDDDPIDIGVSHVKVSILRHAVPFNETLLLFSDQSQFQLGSSGVLTPETVSVNQTTEYECSLKAKPVGVGRFIYFAVSRGTFAGVREYYVDGETESEEAVDITGHVPKYIPGNITRMAASASEDIIICLSDAAPNSIYAYKFFWGDQGKLQSSWSRWVLPEGHTLLDCGFIESKLYLVSSRGDGIHLEAMNLEPGFSETNWDIAVHLDKLREGVSPSFANDQTWFPLAFTPVGAEKVHVVTAPGGSRNPGVVVKDPPREVRSGVTGVLLSGDWTTQPVYIGIPYEFRYTFSTLHLRETSSNGGQAAVTQGRVQLRRVSVLYDRTGYFRAEVTPRQRDTFTKVFSGRVVGSGQNLIGQVAIEEGVFAFPVASKNDQVTIELVNDTFLPCAFLSADWEAFYTTRSRRI